VPTASEFWALVDKDKAAGIDGHSTADSRLDDLKQRVMAHYGVQKLEDLPVNFSGIALQAGEEYTNTIFDKHYGNLWDIYEKQEQIHKASAIVAPLLAIRSLSMGLAGTDLAHHRHFIAAAEQYRRELNKMLNDDLTYSAKRQGFAYFASDELWGKTPDFNYKAPSFSWAVQKQMWSIGLLLVWFITLIVGSVIAAGRMRIY
jgi:ABC-2 type transport system permease protein